VITWVENTVLAVWLIILCVEVLRGTNADCSLEMMDKVEPPAVADGYGVSVAFVCMLDIVKSIQSLLQPAAESSALSASASDVPLTKSTVDHITTPDTGIHISVIFSQPY